MSSYIDKLTIIYYGVKRTSDHPRMEGVRMYLKHVPEVLDVITNPFDVYEGNLVHYFQKVFHATNVRNGYHNFEHMMHVASMCYHACVHYTELNKRDRRSLLIAALFHDFDHTGMSGNDSQNIARATKALGENILPQDKPFFPEINYLVQITKYPYEVETEKLSLSGQILRDADMSQIFLPNWMQSIIFGFSTEWRKTSIEVLAGQKVFQANLKFHTDWAQKLIPQHMINNKIREIDQFLELLTMEV